MDKDYEELLKPGTLIPWLDDRVPELGDGPLQAEALSGGATNLVLKITRGKQSMALRRPAASKRQDSNKVIDREARLLTALNDTNVPHPYCYSYCDDEAVIGVRFFIMELIDGWQSAQVADCPPPFDKPGKARSDMAFALVGGIAELSKVDYRSVGLEGFGKPEGFLQRQVDRWLYQFDSYRQTEGYDGRSIQGLDYVTDWLRDNQPETERVGVIHCDYGFANVMYAHNTPTRLAAIIDWELATVGDTMLDLGFMLYTFRSREGTPPTGDYFDPSDFPTREELADYYVELTGANVEHLTYYMVLSQFKLASLLEGHYARYLAGKQNKDMGLTLGGMVQPLISTALNMAKIGR